MGNNVQDKNLKRITFCLLFLSLIFLSSLTIGTDSAAPIIYVNHATGKNIWDGQSPVWNGTSGPKATIQNGINSVNNKGTVNVAAGTYNEHLKITKSLKLMGQKQSRTIIDGTHSGTVVYVNQGISIRITNFTILHGKAISGGGIYNTGTCTVTKCTITNNYANKYGGGIYNTGTCTVTNCIIKKNTESGTVVDYAGGGIVNYRGNCSINESKIRNNIAKNGAGIANIDGICKITNCNITNNTSFGDGGAILNYCMVNVTSSALGTCVLILKGCSFVGNVAGLDGGVISNHVIVDVTGSGVGSGVGACVLILKGCSFVGNGQILQAFPYNLHDDLGK